MSTIFIGDIVNYHSVIGGPVTSSGHKVKQIAYLNDQIVAYITGKSGCVSIKALSHEEED